jgi:hypothetical protein
MAGDQRAIEALFREHAPGRWRFAYKYLHSGNDAKEVVQDAFIVVWYRRSSIRVHGQLGAYLATAVRNRALTAPCNEVTPCTACSWGSATYPQIETGAPPHSPGSAAHLRASTGRNTARLLCRPLTGTMPRSFAPS